MALAMKRAVIGVPSFQQAFARQLAVVGFRIDAEGNGIRRRRHVNRGQDAAAWNSRVAFAAFEPTDPVVGTSWGQMQKVLEENERDHPSVGHHVPGDPAALCDIFPMQLDSIRLRAVNQKQEKRPDRDHCGSNDHFVQVGPGDQPDPSYGETNRQEDDHAEGRGLAFCRFLRSTTHT